MASKKDYDKVVKKNGKLASFLSEKPLSAAQRKAAGKIGRASWRERV